MEDWLAQATSTLVERPLLQGLLALCASTFMEKPMTLVSAVLVANGTMNFAAAFAGLTTGIMIGDTALYGFGRFAGGSASRWGLLRPNQVERAGQWYARNSIAAVALCRCVPGFRLPINMTAGIVHTPFWRFALTNLLTSACWAFALLTLAARLGESLLSTLGHIPWTAVAAVIVLAIALQFTISRYTRKLKF